MNKRKIILLIFLAPMMAIVLACYRSIPQSTSSHFQPLHIPTEPGTVRPKPSPHTHILSPSANRLYTPTPTINASVQIEFYPTPQPTPTLAFPLPQIQAEASAYTLTNSLPKTLIQLQLSRSGQFLYSNSKIDILLYPALHNVIDYEWGNAYTQNHDLDQLISLVPNFYDHSRGRLTNLMLMDLIGDYVIGLLNQGAIQLENGEMFSVMSFSVASFQVEIDNDSDPEWLIQIKNPDGYYLGEDNFWATLNQSSPGQYQRLANQVPWQYGSSTVSKPKGLIADLTGDGITDIAIVEDTPKPGGALFTFHVARGSPTGFYIIPGNIEIETSNLPHSSSATFEWVTDPDGGIPFLLVQTKGVTQNWLCEFKSAKEVRWKDGIEQVTDFAPQIPDTPNCAISQALAQDSQANHAKSIHWLELAASHLDDLTLEEQVYVYFRLALYQLLDHQNEAAKIHLDKINALSNQGAPAIAVALMKQINASSAQDPLNPYRLCLAAESISKIDKNTPRDPVNGILSYPYVGHPAGYPTPLCDTYQFLETFLNSMVYEFGETPEDQFINTGIPYRYLLDLNQSGTESYWVAVIEDYNYNLIHQSQPQYSDPEYRTFSIFRFDQNEWVEIFRLPATGLETINLSDHTADGFIDFAFFQRSLNPDWISCDHNEVPFDVHIITALYDQWIIPFSESICIQQGIPPDFSALLADSDQDKVTDIIAKSLESQLFDLSLLSEITPIEPMSSTNLYKNLYSAINIDYLVTDLTNLILINPDPEAMQPILNSYIQKWGNHDDIGLYLQAHLNYLSALLFEMSGKEEDAVMQFYKIWKENPDSIWAYLASSRLVLRDHTLKIRDGS